MKSLLTSILLLLTTLVYSQTVDVVVETPPTITRCGAEETICVTIENNTLDTLLSVTGQFTLPAGADVEDYESKPPGSISLMGDILNIPNLLPGESYAFSVSFGVNCATPEGAGTITYTIDYTRMSDMMMDNASGITSSFQIQSADLSTPTSTPGPVEVYKGYTFTVNTLVANGGNGVLEEFLYCVSNDNPNVMLTGISIGGTPLVFHGAFGNFNCYLTPPIASNGSLTVDEEWEVVDCIKPSPPILRRAQVLCEDSDDCQMKPQGVFLATDLIYELAIPILEVVQDMGSPTRPPCYTETASDASFTITNNGTAPAEDVVIAISSASQIVGMSYMLSSSEVIPESLPESVILDSDCNGTGVIKSLTDTIKGINLPVGGTITVSYQTISNCDCNACAIDNAYQSSFSIRAVSDPCSKFYSNIETVSNGAYDAYITGFVEAPVVLLPGETGTVQYQINSWQYDWLSPSYPNSFFEATITIECGLDYIPGTMALIDQNGLVYPVCSEIYVDGGLGSSDNLVIRWCQADRPPGFVVGGDAELAYDIQVDCSEKPLPPCGNLQYNANFTLQADIEIDPTCMATCTRQKIWAPEDIDIDFYCPNSGCMPCDGMQITSLTFERQTYGLGDNNDDQAADGAIDLAKIELDRYLAGDTIKATFKGYISDPAPNDVWNYGFATVYFEHSNFTPIGAQVIINDADGPTYTCNAIDIIPDFMANTITVDFSSGSMNGFGCGIPAMFDFDDGDSVQVCLYFQEKDSITVQQEQRVYETDFYVSDGDFGIGTTFQCSDRKARMTQIGIEEFDSHSDGTFGACELSPITIREDRYYGAQGNDEFPFEIRALGSPKTVSFTKPSEFEYRLDQTQVLLQQTITGTPVTNVVPLTIIPPAYLIQNGDQVTFLAEDYFNSLGSAAIPLDEGYSFYFYPKFQGGCKSVPNETPGYDYSYVVSSTVDQSVFCTSMIMSDTVSDQIGYSEAPELDVIPEETLVRLCSAGDSVVIRVENPTDIPALNGFIYATSPTGGVIINSIVDIATNTVLTPNAFGIYDIGSVPALATQRYKVLMTANSCETEQLAFVAGWDCIAVPTTVEEALCSAPSIITFTSALAGMNIDVLNPSADTMVSLCTITTIEVQVRSTDLGYLRDIFLNTILPPGMEYIPGSFYLSNPGIAQGGSYTSLNDPDPAVGGFSLNISAQDIELTNIGLVGSKDLSRNTIDVRFDVQTMCGYSSGASVDFIVLGNNNCGDPLTNVAKPSFRIKVTDEEPEFDVNINLDDAVINPCNADSITPVVEMQLVGGIPTNLDSVQFILPPGIKYVPGSYLPISNAIAAPPTERIVNGVNILVWPFDALIMVGDVIKFSVKLTNDGDQLECADYELKVQTFASTEEMCGMITCNVGIIAGEGKQKITVIKPELQFVTFDANILIDPNAGTEEASFDIKILNNGAFLLPGDTVALDIYEDVDRNGVKSAPDILLATLFEEVTTVLNPGECLFLDSMIVFPSGTICTLIGVLDPVSTCTCFEEPSNQVKVGIDIDFTIDTMICSDDVINIGPAAIPNYSFEWLSYNGSPLSLLGSTMISPTTFSYTNMSGSPITYEYVLRSSSTNCYTFDTVSITIAPVIMEVRNVVACDGRSFDLPAPSYSGTNYMWSPAAGLSFNGPDMSTATVDMVSGDATYTLTYLDETRCMASLVVNLSAQDCGTAMTALGDTVWFDFDRDGMQEAGEPGIEGVQVNLLDINGNIIRTTFTDANGYYDFMDLIPGTYSVQFHSPQGMIPTLQDNVLNDSLDSDPNLMGITDSYLIPINSFNNTIDAGFIPDCTLDLDLSVSACMPTDTGLIRIVTVDLSWTGNVIYQFYDPDTLEVIVLGELYKIAIDSLEGDSTLTIVTQLSANTNIMASAIFQILTECSAMDAVLGVEPCLFDLALKKVETSTGPYKYDDTVKIEVIVYNQANQKVSNIVVNDYLPDGMQFIYSANPNWTISSGGLLQTIVAGPLCEGESDTIPLVVLLDMGTTDSSWINFAEINSFQDTLGVDMSMFDVDSSPDDTLGNDAGGAPNSPADDYIDGDGTGMTGDGIAMTDEDDQDGNFVGFFDLALYKQIDTAGTISEGTDLNALSYGDIIKFKMILENQGSIPTDTLNITDYIPDGFAFASGNPGNMGWTMISATQYEYMWGGDTLYYSDTTSVCIFLSLEPVPANLIDSETWVNRAEISYAEDLNGVDQSANDADSPLNSNPTDNVGGQPNSPADDFIDGNGTAAGVNGFASTDQDNEDPAFVAMFDLAVTKQVDLSVTPPPYEFGDSIKYIFTVYNQGSIPADSIEITDTIPGGLVFLNHSLNAGWDATNPNKPVFRINSPLASGADTTVCIYLTLQPAAGQGAFVNIGEISSAQDTMGMVRTDADSPLNDNFGDNGGGLPNSPADDEIDGDGTAASTDGFAATDQDNADPAEVQFVDLALLKKIDTLGSLTNFGTDLSAIQYGDTIKFLIVVENQGTVPMDSLIIADYLPAGYTFVATTGNAGWDNSLDPILNYNWGGDTLYYGEKDSICLDLRLESIPLGVTSSAWINRAEIAYAEDLAGTDQSMNDADSPLNNTLGDNEGEPFSDADDYLLGDGKSIGLSGVDSTDWDAEDPAGLKLFDLALVKTIDTAGSFNPGDTVRFKITVRNQGCIPATNITVIDSLPCGFLFVGGGMNPDWSMPDAMNDSVHHYTITDTLLTNEVADVFLYLEVAPLMNCAPMEPRPYDNYAEIFSAQDTLGNNPVDLDSDPNSHTAQEDLVMPQMPGDNDILSTGNDSLGSQDDSDFANLIRNDYALIKKLDPSNSGPFAYGDTVKYQVIVQNQGNFFMDSIEVVDYIPDGLSFDPGYGPLGSTNADLGWTGVDPQVNYTFEYDVKGNDTLLFLETDTICLYLSIKPSTMDGAFINFSEITTIYDTLGVALMADDDSNYGQNGSNAGGAPNTDSDNALFGDGSGMPGDSSATTDADHHDPASLDIVDLALTKTVDLTATPGPYAYDDSIKYIITVYNQGSIVADSIEITDYVPSGLVFDPALNADWTYDAMTNKAKTLIENAGLSMNEDTSVCIYLRLAPADTITAWTNQAEISHAVDPDGLVLDSLDKGSIYNDDPTDNGGGAANSGSDDEILGDGTGMPGDTSSATDQDNADPAFTGFLDLALRKVLDSTETKMPLVISDTIKINIELYNQGSVSVDSLNVTDYIPSGMMFINNMTLNANWDGTDPMNPVYQWGGDTLDFGEADTICVYLELIQPMSASFDAYVNFAEISYAQDTMGRNTEPLGGLIDADSPLNNDPSDNVGSEVDTDADDYLLGDGSASGPDGVDSTDQDNVDGLQLYFIDLALVKTVDISVTPGPYAYGDSVKYLIEIHNRGSIAMDTTEVTDYIPVGLEFDVALNPDWMFNGFDQATFTLTDTLLPGEVDTACIYLRILPADTSIAWTNQAEISHAVDIDSNVVDTLDSDSPLNDDPSDNGGGGPNSPSDDEILGDGTGMPGDTTSATDQDNADPAFTGFLDLALRKVLDSTQTPDPLLFGDTIKMQFEVYNQGSLPVDSIRIVDYLPDGLMFLPGPLNPDWDGTDLMNPVYQWGGDTLFSHEADTVCIFAQFILPASPTKESFINFAEISYARDTIGRDTEMGGGLIDADSPLNDIPTDNVGSEVDTDADDYLLGDGTASGPDGVDSTDQDNVDGLQLYFVDLALTKMIDLTATPGPYSYDDSIKYIIQLHNLGSAVMDTTVITDYIPDGLEFDVGLNPGWIYNGSDKAKFSLVDTFLPGEIDTVCIYLRLQPSTDPIDWINEAEISHAVDLGGQIVDTLDFDSEYNDDPSDNGGGAPDSPSDDEIFGDGTGMPGDTSSATDQDNADPASTGFLDMALRKVLDSTQTPDPLLLGDTVKMQLEVYNQGTLPVDSMDITDYLPAGLEYINDPVLNNGWDGTDPMNPVYNWGGDTLFFGESDTLCLYVKFVDPMTIDPNSYINYAEISFAQDTSGRNTNPGGGIIDADSPLNNDPNDNVGSEPDTDADDYLLGDGSAVGPDGVDSTDQDNVDPLKLYYVDLALTKKIDTDATPGPYAYFDSVKFAIEVFNFGSVTVDTIEVTDYIPEGLEFDVMLNPGWDFDGMNKAKFTIMDTLYPGEIDTICIYLRPIPSMNARAWINESEISHAVDLDGNVVDDLDHDSPLNDDQVDNGGGAVGSPSDNEIFGDGTGMPGDTTSATDQDNADIEGLRVFDLALRKQVDSSFTNVIDPSYEDTIKFKIQVFNQGSELALDVEVNDYLPDGYQFINDATLNPGWTGTGVSPETIVFASIDSLEAQTDTTICLYTILKPVVAPMVAPYRNYAEILTAMDTSGMVPIDMDSEPNSDSMEERDVLPNGPGDDDISSTNRDSIGSDDDHDVASMMIFDLALIKQIDTIETPGPYRYDDPVKFRIKLFNQGGEDIKNIQIVDYIPCGMEYIQAENSGWTLLDDSTASYTYTDTLIAWGTDSICITLHPFNVSADASCNAGTAYENFAEIAYMEDLAGNPLKDIDSPLDTMNTDPGGGPGTDDDDRIDGTGEMGDDEDNHDGAEPELYDLALIKTTDQVVVNVGDVVLFNIQVINQGNRAATDVSVVDYIPESFDFINNAAVNPGWMLSGTDAIFEFIDSLPIGGDTTIQISLEVNANLTEYGLVNFAEIEGSEEMDNGSIDADSDPMDNPGMFVHDPASRPDPNGGNPFDDSDNEIHEEAIKMQDSDDHDGAFVVVCQPFACKQGFNASLGYNCEFELHPSMFFKSFPIPHELVEYTIKDEFNRIYHTDILGEQFLGQCLNITVRVPICGSNSCWVEVCVENKFPPLLECTNDTIGCYDPLPGLPDAGPNCNQPYEVEVVFQKWHPFDCDDDENFEGFYSRTIRATDAWGQIRDCMDTIFIKRIDMDSIRCPENVVINCCVKGLVPGTTDSVALLWSDYFTDIDANGIPHPKPIVDENGNSIGLVDPPYIVESGDTSWLLNTKGNCQIVSNYHDHVFPACGGTFKIKRTWEIQNWCAERDTICIQWIKVVDTVPPVVDETSIEPITAITNASTCEAEIMITRPTIKEECSLKFYKGTKGEELIKVHYLIEVPSYDHKSGKEVFFGPLAVGETVKLTLPAGNYKIQWTLTDDCWQTAEILQDVIISDETGPLAICDFSHVLTLDANQCWGRIYAKDLDDGSFDNCCEEIHYAVAKMSDIETWTNKLRADIISCEGEDVYQANRKAFEEQISIFIGCYVFDDYVDVTGCGEEMLVFRAYQACGLPLYNPNTFYGTMHEWYCVNAYTSFAAYWDLYNYKTIEDFSYCATVSLNIAGSMNYDLPVLNPLYTECMSTLRKDDKQAPVCIAPDDYTVYNDGIPTSGSIEVDGSPVAYTMAATAADVICSNPAVFPWDVGAHGYYSGPLFDGLGDPCVYDPMATYVQPPVYCRFWLLLDQLDALAAPQINFGEPVISDVCTAPEGLDIQMADAGTVDDCGVGSMTRTWTISDRCGNTTSCYQTITILARSDFEVIFPRDTFIDCADAGDLSPELLGKPIVSDDESEDIAISSSDETFELIDGCSKIIRRWKVTNWCVYDPNFAGKRAADIIVDDRYRAGDERACVLRSLKDEGDGIIEYIQVIKIVDNEAPEITCAPAPPVFESTLDTCGPLNISFLLGSATDNCTPEEEMIYRYFYRDTALTVWAGEGIGNTFNENVDLGVYDVFFVAEDSCHNTDTCIIQIEVRDGKAPTAICQNNLTTLIMPSSGMIIVDASIFDAGASDNCTDAGDLIFSFTPDGLSPTDTFTCVDIPDGISVILSLDIYILDEAGNVGQCADVQLKLEDSGSNPICPDIPQQLVTVSGQIMTENSEGVEDVLVDMQPYTSKRSDRKGSFDFEQIAMNKAYDLVPYYNEDPLNGVSTLDLVGIQKHILGIAPLESPYRIIAADINNSKSVTAIDIVELRKLILGIYDEFPDNTSWRFVDAKHEFGNPVRPWNFMEMIKLDENRMNDLSKDFIGIKVGDVNGTVAPHELLNASIRNNRPVYDWTIEDQALVRDGLYEVEVLASRDVELTGFQNTLDLGDLDYMSIKGGSIAMTVDHIGLRYIEDGLLTMSWHSDHGRLVKAGEVLFTLKVKARSDGKLSELIELNSQVTKSELYDGKLAIHAMKLDFGITDAHMLVDQNRPNPFIDKTMIRFDLPISTEVEILIYNNQGILMKEHQAYYNRGKHEYEVKALDLGSSGVYHYEVKTENESVMKKMILLR